MSHQKPPMSSSIHPLCRPTVAAVKWMSVACLSLTTFGFNLSGASAQDAPPESAVENQEQQEKPEQTPLKQAQPDKPSPSPRASSLDEELEKSLGGKPAQESDDDPLERVIRQMRQAEQRITTKDAGEETRTIQKDILKDLDSLIELVKKQQQQQQQQASKPKPQPKNEQLDQTQQAQPENSSKAPSGTQDGPRRKNDKAEDSTEKVAKGKATAADLARRDRLERDVWGHLPPSVRQELLNVYSENFLPKYEDLVRRYYEALAEQNRKR